MGLESVSASEDVIGDLKTQIILKKTAIVVMSTCRKVTGKNSDLNVQYMTITSTHACIMGLYISTK